MASAEPYASYLHFAPEDNHASTSSVRFLRAGCPSWHPTNSVKALKANCCTTAPLLWIAAPQSAGECYWRGLIEWGKQLRVFEHADGQYFEQFLYACHDAENVFDKYSTIHFDIPKKVFIYR